MNHKGAPDLLRGALDLHVHSAPSLFPRVMDDRELVRAMCAAGMGGVVLKAHEGSTAERAWLAQQEAPAPFRVIGSLTLNYFVGGFNAAAVEVALKLGARVVWFPTVHAANHIRFYGGASYREMPGGAERAGRLPGLTVWASGEEARDERLAPQVHEVLEVIAAFDAVLATGHLSPRESLVLVREARRQGVQRILVTHPTLPVTRVPLELQREMSRAGAWMEHSFLPMTEKWGGFDAARMAHELKEVGYDRCVLQTDLGQAGLPTPPDGMATLCERLLAAGVPEQALRRMVAENPYELLGLPAPAV